MGQFAKQNLITEVVISPCTLIGLLEKTILKNRPTNSPVQIAQKIKNDLHI